LYYTDYAGRPAEAVRVMEREVLRRRDATTLDTYAWALFKAGRREEARHYSTEALAVGTVEPSIRRHAATIAGSGGGKAN
jgi:Flp pilus assembly protein TadD